MRQTTLPILDSDTPKGVFPLVKRDSTSAKVELTILFALDCNVTLSASLWTSLGYRRIRIDITL